jgi:RNA polymerase sigma-70 factor (ECF subfamily)
MVWRYLRLLGADPHEADDLMQDTFVRLAEVLARGEPLQAPAAFLRGIGRNLLIGIRRRARTKGPTVEWADAVDRFAGQPQALEDGRIEALRRCIARLTGRARQVVEWHHVEGASYRDAAARLGIGVQGIKSLLARAREALRQCIEQQMKGERTS